MINTDSSSDRSLFIDDDTKSFDSNPDRMEDSQTFTGIPSEDLMVNNDNNSSNNDFEIGDNSFDQSPLMKDTKSSSSDLVDSIGNSASFSNRLNEDPMINNDDPFDRSLFMSNDTKNLDLVDIINNKIEDSVNFASSTFNENFC